MLPDTLQVQYTITITSLVTAAMHRCTFSTRLLQAVHYAALHRLLPRGLFMRLCRRTLCDRRRACCQPDWLSSSKPALTTPRLLLCKQMLPGGPRHGTIDRRDPAREDPISLPRNHRARLPSLDAVPPPRSWTPSASRSRCWSAWARTASIEHLLGPTEGQLAAAAEGIQHQGLRAFTAEWMEGP
jgi:hypothetical protein